MDFNARGVQNKLTAAWIQVRASMQQMYQAGDVRPKNAEDIFIMELASKDEIKFTIKPIIFNIRERAQTTFPNLYIGVQGRLSFAGPFGAQEPLRMKSFSTSVGYFRKKGENLEHIYGVHYDCDEDSFGHPVFHAQLGSQINLKDELNKLFHKEWSPPDKVVGILKNVRTPSAEMDIFSVFVQICGDHLIHSKSGPEEKDAFSKLLDSCGFFTGVASRVTNLYQESQPYCYRSRHWYAGTSSG